MQCFIAGKHVPQIYHIYPVCYLTDPSITDPAAFWVLTCTALSILLIHAKRLTLVCVTERQTVGNGEVYASLICL